METINENPILNEENIKHVGFRDRFIAVIIDTFVLSPFIIGNVLNILYLKNMVLFIFLNGLMLLYKPLLEYKYGATVGKMTLKLRVVDYNYQSITLTAAFMRSILSIAPSAFNTSIIAGMFLIPEFQNISTYGAWNAFLMANPVMSLYTKVSWLILVVDFLPMKSDPNKRTLHDRIAKTYVVIKKIDAL